MINTITLLSLLKPTFFFLFNRRRFVYLLTIPFLTLIAVMALIDSFPPFFLAETVQPSLEINFYTFFLSVFSFVFLLLSVMLRAQQLVFFGDGEQDKRLFVPKPDVKLWKYFAKCVVTVGYSFLLSAILTVTLVSIVKYFLPVADILGYLFMAGTILFWPYFFVRFIFRLPATAAGDPLGYMESWRMTRSINVALAVLLLLFLFLPLFLMLCVYRLFRILFSASVTSFFMNTFGVTFVLLIGAVLLAAYCGYLYSLIRSKN